MGLDIVSTLRGGVRVVLARMVGFSGTTGDHASLIPSALLWRVASPAPVAIRANRSRR